MLYVKEIFGPTIQGEGETAGEVAVFVRFAGCNMWDGRPETREKSKCPYCDTDFFKGEAMTPAQVIKEVVKLTPDMCPNVIVVLTGGEPLLQDKQDMQTLVSKLSICYGIQVETNGTVDVSHLLDYLDYITCSPKVPLEELKIDLKEITSLKLLYPHPNPKLTPEVFTHLIEQGIDLYLQPIDDEKEYSTNLKKTVEKVLSLKGDWMLSLQTHKIVGVP